METTTFNMTAKPVIVDTPNAIYEHSDVFSVVGANTAPTGMTLHIQFARDIAEAPRDSAGLSPAGVAITRRVCATISMPAHAAEALAKAILQTLKAEPPKE